MYVDIVISNAFNLIKKYIFSFFIAPYTVHWVHIAPYSALGAYCTVQCTKCVLHRIQCTGCILHRIQCTGRILHRIQRTGCILMPSSPDSCTIYKFVRIFMWNIHYLFMHIEMLINILLIKIKCSTFSRNYIQIAGAKLLKILNRSIYKSL